MQRLTPYNTLMMIGVVLAGGEGRRMGRTKGDIDLGGTTFATRAAQALRPLCGSVLISIAKGKVNPAPSYETVEDEGTPGMGPLAGIRAAFASTGQADLLVLACDYPRVGSHLLQAIVEAAEPSDDLVMLTDPKGRDHPLVALWRRSAEPVVNEALSHRQYKVRALLGDLVVKRLGPKQLSAFDLEHSLTNANTPPDLTG
jgi:molybdopterin-guanine dinucleotide biosynthesis protein A